MEFAKDVSFNLINISDKIKQTDELQLCARMVRGNYAGLLTQTNTFGTEYLSDAL